MTYKENVWQKPHFFHAFCPSPPQDTLRIGCVKVLDSSSLGISEWLLQVELAQIKWHPPLAQWRYFNLLSCIKLVVGFLFVSFFIFKNYFIQVLLEEDINSSAAKFVSKRLKKVASVWHHHLQTLEHGEVSCFVQGPTLKTSMVWGGNPFWDSHTCPQIRSAACKVLHNTKQLPIVMSVDKAFSRESILCL